MGALLVTVDRAAFLSAGRALQRGFKASELGIVSIRIFDGKMTIETSSGGTEITCQATTKVFAELSAMNFKKIISAHGHERDLSEPLDIAFHPKDGQIVTAKGCARTKRLEVSTT